MRNWEYISVRLERTGSMDLGLSELNAWEFGLGSRDLLRECCKKPHFETTCLVDGVRH